MTDIVYEYEIPITAYLDLIELKNKGFFKTNVDHSV